MYDHMDVLVQERSNYIFLALTHQNQNVDKSFEIGNFQAWCSVLHMYWNSNHQIAKGCNIRINS